MPNESEGCHTPLSLPGGQRRELDRAPRSPNRASETAEWSRRQRCDRLGRFCIYLRCGHSQDDDDDDVKKTFLGFAKTKADVKDCFTFYLVSLEKRKTANSLIPVLIKFVVFFFLYT